ncbi:hypothetical protein C8J56DRAFT_1043605 [Mycena floridula]|nr:hypothetical protein C8J56DRAFT_1043605 [Mycena floridula]
MPVLTRRAASAQKSISNAVFPTELTIEIISLCSNSSQATLCRVSKLFKRLAQRLLYQIVYLDERSKAISFKAALSANPTIWNLGEKSQDICRVTGHIVAGILKSTKELRQLTVDWEDVSQWEKLSFVHLRILSIHDRGFHQESLVAAFVKRHPALSHLAVAFGSANSSRPLRIDLPNLTTFEGPY